MKKSASNSAGFTVLEIIVIAGFGLVLLLGLMTVINTQQKSVKNVNQRLQADEAQRIIKNFVADPASCADSLNGLNAASLSVVPSLQRGGTVFYTAGTPMMNDVLVIDSIRIVPTTPPVAPNTRGDTNLRINFRKMSESVGSNIIPKDVKIMVTTGPGSVITACEARLTDKRSCQMYTQSANAKEVSVGCPSGTALVGGGFYDNQVSKSGTYRSHPIAPSATYLGGGWRCRDNDTSNMTCYALCCKFN